jgi:hypothetical protein
LPQNPRQNAEPVTETRIAFERAAGARFGFVEPPRVIQNPRVMLPVERRKRIQLGGAFRFHHRFIVFSVKVQ